LMASPKPIPPAEAVIGRMKQKQIKNSKECIFKRMTGAFSLLPIVGCRIRRVNSFPVVVDLGQKSLIRIELISYFFFAVGV
jgi:hypothetical protein